MFTIFTKNQLYKYYINIGSNLSNLNRNNSYYILGSYRSTSVINLDKTFFNLKSYSLT